jgi:hypothetical protein
LQRQVQRALIVAGSSEVSSTVFYDWCYARRRLLEKRPLTQAHRHSVRRVLMAVAEPIGRAKTTGRPILWRLRDPAQLGEKGADTERISARDY